MAGLPTQARGIIFRVSPLEHEKKEVERTRSEQCIFSLVYVHEDVVRASRVHPRGSQLLSRARGPHAKRARGGDGKGVTWQPLVQSSFSV